MSHAEDRLFRAIEDELPKSEREELEQELKASPALQEQHERASKIVQSMRARPEGLAQVDLSAVIAKKRGEKRPQSPSRTAWIAAASGLAAAAALFLVMRSQPDSAKEQQAFAEGEFQARGHSSLDEAAKFVGIDVYQVDSTGEDVQKLTPGATVAKDAELLFSYNNVGKQSFSHIMIVALGSAGKVHWYFPALEEEDVSVEISPGASQEFPESVLQPLNVGKLRIFAIFSMQALKRARVEAILSKGKAVDSQATLAKLGVVKEFEVLVK